jgi:hypothetical protein
MSSPYWKVDWSTVETFDDLKKIMEATGLTFQGDLQNWSSISEYLVLDYGKDKNG